MEFDISLEFSQFLEDAITYHLEAFPECENEAGKFLDLMDHCKEVGTSLHINF